MYASLVAALFPAYIFGCGIALLLSWNRRSFLHAFYFSFILITFQFAITGKAASLGVETFLWCAYAQIFIGVGALVSGNKWVILGSILAVIANGFEAFMFSVYLPLRDFYFVSINTIQTYQILSLIALSPGMAKIYRLTFNKKERVWKAHQMETA